MNRQERKASRFTPCRERCRAGGECVIAGGHAAPHICRRADCACHTPAGYGLELSERGYVRQAAQYAGVRLLRVRV